MQYGNYPRQPGSGQPQRRPAASPPSSQQHREPGEPRRGQPRRKKSNKPQVNIQNRWFRALVMVLATVAGCIFLAFFILQSVNEMFGLNQPDRIIEVEVPNGASVSDVAAILKRQDVIEQTLTFRFYAELKMKERQPQPGKYIFNSNMGYDEIIVALRSGNSVKEQIRLTFFEGDTVWDIANKLEENRVCEARAFVDYLSTAEFTYEFTNALPDDPLRYHRFEGYLFPDTYDFFAGENVRDVARKFLNNFDAKVTDDLKRQMQELNLTVDEAITLASIIQREAKELDDMHLVSSVFHNRLGNTVTYPNLQSDATRFYVNNNIKPYLLRSNQEMYDAYNTYVREGLPIGPICNPGMNAIRAALHPTDSNYYFFVTDEEGNFSYSSTLADHSRNVAAAKAAGGGHGVATQ